MPYQPLDVLLLGHSFITRLDRYSRRENLRNLQLEHNSHRITFCGRGGKYIDQLDNDIHYVRRYRPDIVVIDIGTNDIEQLVIKERSAEPDVLARQTFDFAKHIIRTLDVKIIVLMEVLERTGDGRHATRSVSGFRTAANRFNNELRDLVRGQSNHQEKRVYFWHHRGLVRLTQICSRWMPFDR